MMKLFLLYYMCHFAMGLTHCYKTTVFFTFIVTMAVSVAVCEIFSVKEWCDLENGVRVRSRSLKLAPFDRSHTSSYSPSIVTIAISCIVCEI